MPLHEYQRKRDFTKSPEPRGDHDKARKKKGPKLFFCVQKHLASHLHYDLRLEFDGVLMSWAVPKGPSLDPSVKRLAMQVEDHPVEYGTFEGVIPSGYGAGIVMLWDEGTWEPESESVVGGLTKGDLKFKLDGYKLKGSWVLVRTRGFTRSRSERSSMGPPTTKDDGRSWLLIKHRDEWSGELDIATFAPLSVKSNQDFHEILADDKADTWTSHREAGGETGAMLREVIEKAALLKAERAGSPAKKAAKPAAKTPAKSPTAKPRARAARQPAPKSKTTK